MNWLFQREGMINRYNSKIIQGIQPVRVLHIMNIFMFINTHSQFGKDLFNAIEQGSLSQTIVFDFKECKVKTPFINAKTRSIVLHESFLSYIWCICHTIYTHYLHKIEFPKINSKSISTEKIEKATELFNYAKFLIVDYQEWDKDKLPNPEKYLAQERDYIEQPNLFYTEAIKFILAHEYTHAILHLDKFNTGIDNSKYLFFEKEADFNAIELLKQNPCYTHPDGRLIIQIGIIIGILSIFYFKSSTSGGETHPDNKDRLMTAISQLGIKDNSECWGFALIGLKLWFQQFNLTYTINENLSNKDSVLDILKQIKK